MCIAVCFAHYGLAQAQYCAGTGRILCWYRQNTMLAQAEYCAGTGRILCWHRHSTVLAQTEYCAGTGTQTFPTIRFLATRHRAQDRTVPPSPSIVTLDTGYKRRI